MATTCPAISCPKIRGAECDPVEIFLRSVPQMPQVWIRTSSSPAPISGTATVSRRMSSLPRYTAACMVLGMTAVFFSASSLVSVAILLAFLGHDRAILSCTRLSCLHHPTSLVRGEGSAPFSSGLFHLPRFQGRYALPSRNHIPELCPLQCNNFSRYAAFRQ